jgi:hypothetical protein
MISMPGNVCEQMYNADSRCFGRDIPGIFIGWRLPREHVRIAKFP